MLYEQIPFSHVRLANIRQLLGELRGAVEEYSSVLEVEPSYMPALKGQSSLLPLVCTLPHFSTHTHMYICMASHMCCMCMACNAHTQLPQHS